IVTGTAAQPRRDNEFSAAMSFIGSLSRNRYYKQRFIEQIYTHDALVGVIFSQLGQMVDSMRCVAHMAKMHNEFVMKHWVSEVFPALKRVFVVANHGGVAAEEQHVDLQTVRRTPPSEVERQAVLQFEGLRVCMHLIGPISLP